MGCSRRSSNVLLFEGFRAKIDGNDIFKIASAYNEHNGCEPVGYLAAEDFMMGLTRKSDVFGFGVVLLELLTGRKAFDQTLPVPILVKWATPLLMEDRVKECIDPKLGDQYDADGALKAARENSGGGVWSPNPPSGHPWALSPERSATTSCAASKAMALC
ncbi:hypothetical protein PR202_ga00274 [Eleusine coracana subsp. coracana]|uniref:Serine-threonine/tyrosine-protein kinase catalytic domain-containing protein n=1 Tax=Eleusine coracana subsp. coracana TaxID=191504 RepID=A0AAV5BDT3_ELECO|nr:hypothetical protein PR202_ga00274 [Eleusine coracana subsp. coracana]